MHFPVFLSSLQNEPLGILGVMFQCAQTRFNLPYGASLAFRNPFCFRLPPHTSSRAMQLPSTRGCLPKAPQQTFTVQFIIMSNALPARTLVTAGIVGAISARFGLAQTVPLHASLISPALHASVCARPKRDNYSRGWAESTERNSRHSSAKICT